MLYGDIMSVNDKITEFITFPRTFEKYAWYKPIIVLILTAVIMLILQMVIMGACYLIGGVAFVQSVLGGKGVSVLNSPLGIFFGDLLIIMFIPALYIASRIVDDRPFSSYCSSRGGWNFKLYFKALIIPVILYIVYSFIDHAIFESNGVYQVSILFVVVLLISVPLQSIAEEFMFRGILLQTLGSWFKIPVLAIVIQALIFAAAHGYNSFGFIEMVVAGLIFGFFAWKTNGLEVSSALHTANNFAVGLFVMLGLHSSTSSPELFSVLGVIVFEIVLCLIMYYVGKKTEWFGEIPENA